MYQQLKRASMALTLSSVCFLAFAQKTIQGTVKDANGDPMIGVTITDQNGKAGGITDLDGKFTIQNADPNAVLTFSYIGCKPKKVKVGSQKTWNIVLEDDNAALDEVVVVGYGTMRKRDVTGSIASVNSEKIAARGTLPILQSLCRVLFLVSTSPSLVAAQVQASIFRFVDRLLSTSRHSHCMLSMV